MNKLADAYQVEPDILPEAAAVEAGGTWMRALQTHTPP